MPWRKAALCRMHSHQQHHVSLTTQRAGSPVKVSQHYRTFQLENERKRVLEIWMLFLKVHNSSHVPIRRNTWQPSAVAIMGSQYRTWICNRVLRDISKQKHSMERKNSEMPIMIFIVAGLNSVGLLWTQFINLKLRYQDFPWFSSIGLGNSHLWCWSIWIYDLSSIAAWQCTPAERRKHVRACDQNTLKWHLHGPRTCPSIQRIDHIDYYGTVNLPHTRVV